MKKLALIMSFVFCFCICSSAFALTERGPLNLLSVNLNQPDEFFAFENYTPANAVAVRVTSVKKIDEVNLSCKYKIESILGRDTKNLPRFDLVGSDVKKGDRFVVLYSRHISYWGDSYVNDAVFRLDNNNSFLYKTNTLSLSDLNAIYSKLAVPDRSLAAQAKASTLILEAKVLGIEGDGSADYAFVSIKPVKTYKGTIDLNTEIVLNSYRPLNKGKTYIFFLKEDLSDLPGDNPALVATDKEAQFIPATPKARKELQKILASQQ